MKVRFVGILVRPDSPDVEQKGLDLAIWLNKQGIATAALNHLAPDMDLLVVLGGDGTLLRAADKASRYALPVLGVNMGNLGFLSEVEAGELYKTITMVLAGEFRIERRLMLQAALVNGDTGEISVPARALNDVVIAKEGCASMLRLHCWAGQEFISTYRADGLIISTPTGSTAYNLAAGGPVVHPEQSSIIVTPMCPFMLASRPVILDGSTPVCVQIVAPEGETSVLADGNLAWHITPNDSLLVRKNPRPLLVVSSPWKSYFNILRHKLSWGGKTIDQPLPDKIRQALS